MNKQPCAIKGHQRGWASSRSEPLPSNWEALKRLVRQRSGGQCEVVNAGVRCRQPMQEVDHIVNRARWPKGKPGLHALGNLQAICGPCHTEKTNQERRYGAKKKWGKL
jgi:5-methylcytosine-specific restriction endonuclease McrA